MTEKEIIEYLKENRTKGVGFIFMPREARIWITSNKSRLDYYNPSLNNWVDASLYGIHYSGIYSLPEDFKFEEKPQESGWFEYEIDKNGNFYSADADDKDGRYYHWSEWNICLANNKDNLVAFGGWQFKEQPDVWFMAPQVLKDNQEKCIKPLFPIKIRFWRESQ